MQVVSVIQARIVNGVWQAGECIPPEKALCAEFEIARGTLRQALQLLETRGYLRREQGRGTFVTYGQGQKRKDLPEKAQVAFVFPYVRNSAALALLTAFRAVVEPVGYSVVIEYADENLSSQTEILHKLADSGVKGIVLCPISSEHVSPIDEVAEKYPIVLISRYLKHFATDYVIPDHFGGAVRGVHYLADLGHRRIGFVAWDSSRISIEHRWLGYKQALVERGIEIDEGLICCIDDYPTINLNPLLNYLNSQRPTAVFAANDYIALSIYSAAAILGLSIPRDLSVLGFDNVDIATQVTPPLTTIAQPFDLIGKYAGEILLRRMNNEQGCEQIILPTELMIRESCARLAKLQPVY